MELRTLLRFLLRKWWLILPIIAIAAGATYYLTRQQTPLYTARATYIAKLNNQVLDDRSLMTALDVFNRNTEIATTYSEIAMSRKIRSQAASRLGIAGGGAAGYQVTSRTVAGSNIIEIMVEGPNAEMSSKFANAIGGETITYVNGLYPTYMLEPLDEALPPAAPSSPNKTLNYLLGGLAGIILGFGAALLSAYLQPPASEPEIPRDPSPPTYLSKAPEEFQKEFASLRLQLNETRAIIKSTEVEARSLRRSVKNLVERTDGKSIEY